MNFFKVLTLFILLFSASCKKSKRTIPSDNPYGLPNATQTGANIFAYLNDGVPQIVRNSIYTLGGGISNDTLFLSGTAGDDNYFETIGLVVVGNISESIIFKIDTQSNFIILDINKDCTGYLGSNVITAYAVSGNIYLSKIDRVNKIISGTFSCRIPVPNCDTLNITEGRFDIRYY